MLEKLSGKHYLLLATLSQVSVGWSSALVCTHTWKVHLLPRFLARQRFHQSRDLALDCEVVDHVSCISKGDNRGTYLAGARHWHEDLPLSRRVSAHLDLCGPGLLRSRSRCSKQGHHRCLLATGNLPDFRPEADWHVAVSAKWKDLVVAALDPGYQPQLLHV